MSTENQTIKTAGENTEPKPGTKAYVEAELAAAKAELEALKTKAAENEAAKAVANASEPIKATEAPARVEVYIPRGAANEETNYIVGINGKKYILPRGKTSMVPPEVKEEIERSRRAQEALDATIDRLLAAADK